MTLAVHFDWLVNGLKSAAAMIWMTFWPLVLGFSLSGCVQAFIRRDGLRDSLGRRGPVATFKATTLGVISSSCSYAASAMARSVFARGASWTNSMVFMVASTNLVIELGIVLWLLLGWQFLVAEFVGGSIMIVLLAIALPRVFRRDREAALRERVDQELADAGAAGEVRAASPRTLDGWSRAARFTWGDLTMLRRELFIGFVVAGFLAADVPESWWNAVFITGHGPWTVIENVIVAPLVAVVSFVCSVGNIPLAAALWARGVAFGGVVAFIFADLVTLPLLLIYRRFYGRANMWRIFLIFWAVMSTAGLLVEVIFRALGWIPPRTPSPAISGTFDLGWTLVLNVAAVVVLVVGAVLVRRRSNDEDAATDPVCGMQVLIASAPARSEFSGVSYYFCSPRCAERFNADPARFVSGSTTLDDGGGNGDAIDPVCSMQVNSSTAVATAVVDNTTYLFCSTGCRDVFVANPTSPDPTTKSVRLGSKPPHE